MSKHIAYICDVCKNDMSVHDIDRNKNAVNAEVYGVHMHTSCFKTLQPLQLIKLLGLDDITINGDKLAYIDERFNQ